MYNENVAASIR